MNLVDGGMVLVMGQDAWVLPAIVRGSSGTALGSSRWMGACSVISGVIVSPAAIYWFRIGSINSFGSGSGGGWLVDAPPIWCDDMHHRYALPICIADMQGMKTEKAKSNTLLAPDVVCDSLLYFCCLIHLIIFPISVGTIRERNASN